MPRFDVLIERERIEYLTLEVDAPTTEDAAAQVRAVIAACHANATALAQRYGTPWEQGKDALSYLALESGR